ncbi:ABC transporter ATP-binding protein [Fusibacter paucivorans]|uniref:Spermidine/putrescine import ATP-binding protein PotA n=1 Tax=Fusibacter paucivorans TaxID=76009 RepID=A0ABS5PN67_9FIRM|nr:spermidine/putrescine ABC transporter ATP-binding protein [Fusibacter paucivorans]MBS7525497.1 ABC transporter ATP-binding protein [Fusibacter paucivorans]
MMDRIVNGINVSKVYNGVAVVKDIDFWVKKNQFLTILGPSGCGKTTTLRMIAGFEQPTAGHIFFEGLDITNIPPYKRAINTVFQKYALFPHLNIYENIAFGLRIKKLNEKEIEKRVARMLELVNLKGFEKRKVHSLSGGQQQRIAIARALVNEPKVLLLDEPLGALDLKLRKEMQIELKNMQRELGITFIYVTHDQEEALTMSDKIIIMNQGEIQQTGSPIDIYNEPENAFVADFIGESNIFDGTMPSDCRVLFANREFECVDSGFQTNESVDVVIRPEDVTLSEPEAGVLTGEVTSVVFKGVHYEMLIQEGPRTWMVHNTLMAPEGAMVGLSVLPNDIHIMHKEG